MCKECISKNDIKYKTFKIAIKGTETVTKSGVEYGLISGYAATYGNVDRGGDIIKEGAFTKSIKRHEKTNRQIRMLYQHNRDKLIGGFPIDKVIDDEKGLYVEGEINLSVPEGKSAYALAKQGVLTDFSIGYSIVDYEYKEDIEILVLKEIELWEISTVSEPMNPEATIDEVKSFDCMKDIETFLKKPFQLSGKARKIFISKIKSFSRDVENDNDNGRDVLEKNNGFEFDESIMINKLDELNKILNED